MRPTLGRLVLAITVVLLALMAPAADATLLAWWKFDEASGTDVSDSQGTYNGTVTGTAAWVAGRFDNAIQFTGGSGDRVTLSTNVPMSSPTWTMSAWFNDLDPQGAWRTLTRGADIGGVTGDHQVIVQDSSQNLGMYKNAPPGGGFLSAGYNMTGTDDGQWHNIVAVGANGTTTMYVDGAYAGTSARQGATNINTIGNYVTGGQRFAQYLDDMAVWDNQLSPLDIQSLGTGAARPDTVSAAELVSYRIQVGAPTSDASVIGYVSDDLEVQGAQFLSASSGAGSNVVTATGTLAWRLGVTDFLQLEVNGSGTPSWDQAPYVAATFTAPRGYIWEETGNQYLWTRSGPTGVPANEPMWFASSQRWGSGGYVHGDYDPEQGVYASNVIEISPPGPTPPLGPGFAPPTKAVWGMGAGGEHLQPSFLDTQGTLVAGAWAAVGTPLAELPGGSGAGVSTMVVRTTNAINDLSAAADALWLRPGMPTHSMSEVRTMPVTHVDGAGAGYDMTLRDGAGNPIGVVPVLAGTASWPSGEAENYAFKWAGYVHIPSPGDYSFAVGSNDGARLTIGETVVYENLGAASGAISHTSTPLSFSEGGYWPFSVEWFQGATESPATLGLIVSAKLGNDATWDSGFVRLGDPGGLAIYTRPDGLTPLTQTVSQGLFGTYYDTSGVPDDSNWYPNVPVIGRRLDWAAGGPWTNTNLTDAMNFYVPFDADGEQFATMWQGRLNIPTAGTYSFQVQCDDRGWFFIDTDGDGIPEPMPGQPPVWSSWLQWNNLSLSAGDHAVEFRSSEFGGGETYTLQWTGPGISGWQNIPATALSVAQGGPVGAEVSGPPVFAGAIDTQQNPGDGLRVQQASIANVANVDAVRSFFSNKIVHSDPAKNLFDSPSPGVIRRYMDMVDPDNPANGNFGVNEAFPNNTGGDDDSFGTRINGLFYAQSAGIYSFTVSSDDSFWLRVGSKSIGSFAGNRAMPTGTANQMYVYLPQAGLYPLEFYSHSSTGPAGIEVAHGGETTLLVTSRDPSGSGFTVDWGGAGYSVRPVAKLLANSVALQAQAYGEVPALAGVPLSDGKFGVVAPEYWKLEQVLSSTVTLRTPDPNNAGQYITGLRGRWYMNTANPPTEPPIWDSDTTGEYYNQVYRTNYQYDNPGPGGGNRDNFRVRYTGQIYIPAAGDYIFGESVDDYAWIFIDGTQRLYDGAWSTNTQVTVNLNEGWHDLELRSGDGGSGDFAYFFWDNGTGTLPLPLGPLGRELNASELAALGPYVLTAGYEELLLLAEGTGAIGDLLGYETMMLFPMDWHQQYTLRLTTDIAGLTAVYEGTFKFLPEPTTLVVLAGGLLAVARRRRKRRS